MFLVLSSASSYQAVPLNCPNWSPHTASHVKPHSQNLAAAVHCSSYCAQGQGMLRMTRNGTQCCSHTCHSHTRQQLAPRHTPVAVLMPLHFRQHTSKKRPSMAAARGCIHSKERGAPNEPCRAAGILPRAWQGACRPVTHTTCLSSQTQTLDSERPAQTHLPHSHPPRAPHSHTVTRQHRLPAQTVCLTVGAPAVQQLISRRHCSKATRGCFWILPDPVHNSSAQGGTRMDTLS